MGKLESNKSKGMILMKQKRVVFDVNHDEVYRCKECFDVAFRVTWISTGRGTINLEWVFVYCPTCDKLRWQRRE
ncbi:hypothetical protein [Bacillus cereus]|uniref:hypothetical protein n=1 Tax=Bacillus cereus TaxID=1396 RepID=UPI0027DBF39A|nr:hypothetical protein [Bacillus cereus]